MFVNQLSQQEKQSLIQLFTVIAKADGQIVNQEWSFLNHYANEYGVTYNLNASVDLAEVCAQLHSPTAKMVAIQALIKMALVDDDYSDHERNRVRQIADLLALSAEKLIEIEDWVIEGYRWQQKGAKIICSS